MTDFQPGTDWLFLPEAPLSIATGDAINRWTFLNHLRYRLRKYDLPPTFRYDEDDQVLTTFELSGFEVAVRLDTASFWVSYEGYHYVDAPFWAFARLAMKQCLRDPGDATQPNVLDDIAAVWSAAVAITDMQLERGNWVIKGRVERLTNPFVEIPRDMWVHFEISDWLKGVATSKTGDTIYSIHLAPSATYAPCNDPEAFLVAHPESHLVGGELVPNASLYSLRTTRDHPANIYWFGVMGFDPDQPVEQQVAGYNSGETDGHSTEVADYTAKVAGFVVAETRCTSYLAELMSANLYKPVPKDDLWNDARGKFTGLSRNAFDRAWASAIKASHATAWRRAGRRKKT